MPADVLSRRRQLMLNGDAGGLADLFAPDAVMEFCFHGPPGTPVRLAGREAIREYSRRVMALPLRIEAYYYRPRCLHMSRQCLVFAVRHAGDAGLGQLCWVANRLARASMSSSSSALMRCCWSVV